MNYEMINNDKILALSSLLFTTHPKIPTIMERGIISSLEILL